MKYKATAILDCREIQFLKQSNTVINLLEVQATANLNNVIVNASNMKEHFCIHHMILNNGTPFLPSFLPSLHNLSQ
jgi:hypothetical protein